MALSDFIARLEESLKDATLVKVTLSKSKDKSHSLKNVYVRRIMIKDNEMLSFTLRHQTNDQTKNYELADGVLEIKRLLSEHFLVGNLLTTVADFTLQISKKGKESLTQKKASNTEIDLQHDSVKTKRTSTIAPYLFHLKVTDQEGNVIPKMADKFRQINKFLEIMESLLTQVNDLGRNLKIVDMGSGKGYLTFALYDFLTNRLKKEVEVIGIEMRPDMVQLCNDIATKCNYEGLSFRQQSIEAFDDKDIDILIALHACDTATDDALSKGLHAKAKLIVCAPCCHKQIRQQLKGKEQQNPILKYGIFKERQYEMVTDTIRALILEREGYESKVFEFISNEHTRKNVMLVGIRNNKPKKESDAKIEAVKAEFGIEFQYLERLLD